LTERVWGGEGRPVQVNVDSRVIFERGKETLKERSGWRKKTKGPGPQAI